MQTDVLIIGCGIAGATTALKLAADRQRQITIITRAELALDSNSSLAQGGIVDLGEDDSAELLASDILAGGAGLSYPPAVKVLTEEGPALLRQVLIEQSGLDFDRDANRRFILGLEAAHSRRRILHVGDTTGKAIMQALLAKLADQPNVTLLTDHTAVDLLTFPHHSQNALSVYEATRCQGAYVFDHASRQVEIIVAAETVMATGGLGQIFLNTSNPIGARGDGIAMAYRAGARVINAEYVQFHPTTLAMPGTAKFLISEAVRGEGATLLTPEGKPFPKDLLPQGAELAGRDRVARAIYWLMLNNNYTHVLLDISSHKPADYIRQRFPRINEQCLAQNIDMSAEPIPVVPAAHYSCGGVRVDLSGRSSLAGLYAVGEVACTGVHGANRLASTSLLEGLVWGVRAAAAIQDSEAGSDCGEQDVPPWSDEGLTYDADPALIQGDMQNVRNLMWHYVGLVRNEHRLTRALSELRHLWMNIDSFYRKVRLSDGLIGLRNTVQTALIVANAARKNQTSRGCHYRDDAASVVNEKTTEILLTDPDQIPL
jgi:L-aspartate oxidase